MSKRKSLVKQFSEIEIAFAIANSDNYADALRHLGYCTTSGGNYKTLKKYVEEHGISTAHFSSDSYNRHLSDEEVFCKDSKASQNATRRHYLKLGCSEYVCSICGQPPVWNGKPLVLTLDHINGDNHDNRLENLRWVCPNCDRQLPTYGNKRGAKLKRATLQKLCKNCGQPVSPKATFCASCVQKMSRENMVDKETLLSMLSECHNFTEVGRKLGVSHTTIRRWCKCYGLSSYITNYKPQAKPKEKIVRLKAVRALNKQTNECVKEFKSITEASLWLNKNKGEAHIIDVCRGKRKSAYGYKWEYLVDAKGA